MRRLVLWARQRPTIDQATLDAGQPVELLRQHVMDWGQCDHRDTCDCSDARSWRWLRTHGIVVLAVLFAAVAVVVPPADAHPTVVPASAVSRSNVKQSPDVLMLAAAKLGSYGYTVSTPAQLDRAIRHWQKANGLKVDGIVGPITSRSLGLNRPATVPAASTAPAPAADPSPAPVPAGDVEAIIRDVWPDDLENEAVRIATRESNLQPGVRNACCFGLFQLYWTVHRGWLADLGVTDSSQLFDARTNATAALALYQRNGWAPWAL